jgi:hypothetical protein
MFEKAINTILKQTGRPYEKGGRALIADVGANIGVHTMVKSFISHYNHP